MGSFQRAASNLESGLTHCPDRGPLKSRLLIRLAAVYILQNRDEEAHQTARRAVRAAKSAESIKLEAEAKAVLAESDVLAGNLTEGLSKLNQSLALSKAAGETTHQLSFLTRMATIYRTLRMWPQFDAANDEALALSEIEGGPSRRATALINAAIASAERGHRMHAAKHLYLALKICRKNGYWDWISTALVDLADALFSGEDPSGVDRYYLAAVAAARRRFDGPTELEALHRLALTYLRDGAYAPGLVIVDKVIELAGKFDDTDRRIDGLRIGGVYRWRTGDTAGAIHRFDEALSASREAGNEALEARSLVNYGSLMEAKYPERAAKMWRSARRIFSDLGKNDEVLLLDRILLRQGPEPIVRREAYRQTV